MYANLRQQYGNLQPATDAILLGQWHRIFHEDWTMTPTSPLRNQFSEGMKDNLDLILKTKMT